MAVKRRSAPLQRRGIITRGRSTVLYAIDNSIPAILQPQRLVLENAERERSVRTPGLLTTHPLRRDLPLLATRLRCRRVSLDYSLRLRSLLRRGDSPQAYFLLSCCDSPIRLRPHLHIIPPLPEKLYWPDSNNLLLDSKVLYLLFYGQFLTPYYPFVGPPYGLEWRLDLFRSRVANRVRWTAACQVLAYSGLREPRARSLLALGNASATLGRRPLPT
jgi:hypothetical protein